MCKSNTFPFIWSNNAVSQAKDRLTGYFEVNSRCTKNAPNWTNCISTRRGENTSVFNMEEHQVTVNNDPPGAKISLSFLVINPEKWFDVGTDRQNSHCLLFTFFGLLTWYKLPNSFAHLIRRKGFGCSRSICFSWWRTAVTVQTAVVKPRLRHSLVVFADVRSHTNVWLSFVTVKGRYVPIFNSSMDNQQTDDKWQPHCTMYFSRWDGSESHYTSSSPHPIPQSHVHVMWLC